MEQIFFIKIFERVIDAVGGTQIELARRINLLVEKRSRKVTPQAVSKWKKGIPADRVLEVEKVIGGKLTRYDLRPDIFGEPPHQAAA